MEDADIVSTLLPSCRVIVSWPLGKSACYVCTLSNQLDTTMFLSHMLTVAFVVGCGAPCLLALRPVAPLVACASCMWLVVPSWFSLLEGLVKNWFY